MNTLPYRHSGATAAWRTVLETIFAEGLPVAPRGRETIEVLHSSVAYAMVNPLVRSPARKLSHRFLAAEALWILAGDDRVETIAAYNKNIAQFSDDGRTFFGAYGPKIVAQLPYVVDALHRDRDTRQAVINIWRESPLPTKDVPCTVSMTFGIRAGRLNAHVHMRSSDAWLGVPYDFFNYALIALRVACEYNARGGPRPYADRVAPGDVYWTAVSSHLYADNLADAARVLAELRVVGTLHGARIPDDVVRNGAWDRIEAAVVAARDGNRPPDWRDLE